VMQCCLAPPTPLPFKIKENMHLLPQQPQRQRTEQQTRFLEAFEEEFDVDAALISAGYNPTSKYKVVKSLADEILALTQSYLALHSPGAARQIVDRMETGGLEDPASKAKFEAAKGVLDRVGIGKREIVQHEGEVMHGVVLLPAKTERIIDADFHEA